VAKLLDFIDRVLGIVRPAPPVVLPRGTALVNFPEFIPSGFRYGVEILNDDSTPMQFVVSVLESVVGLGRTEAVRTMLEIHKRGGALLPTPSADEAKRIAGAVTAEAASCDHPLVCRAVILAPSNQRLERP
jgi:ATP-dependent Clp protease adaptor protein ClpS